ELLDIRLRGARHAADSRAVNGGVAPTQDLEALFAHDAFYDAFGDKPLLAFHRKKDHAHAVLAGGRQGETQLGAVAGEELVRDLNKNAGAVASFRIAAASAPMG